jgi:ABC-2 type transport system permease protein
MFLHNHKYSFLITMRQKEFIFWLMCFPLILGTFFYMAFGNIYEEDEIFTKIPIAVVGAESDAQFKGVLDEISSGKSGLFDVKYTDAEKARKLLKDSDVTGIVNVNGKISLSVASNGISQTIIKSFLEQYNVNNKIIMDTAKNNPEKIQNVIKSLSGSTDSIDDVQLTSGSMNVYTQYFYNLIAMVALYGTLVGLNAATSNQGNLSEIGARKCVSPTPKMKTIIATLIASCAAQIICIAVCITYLLYVLKVDMGGNAGMIYLSGFIGGITGVAMGFFIGSVGRASNGVKVAISMSVSIICCFMSGLMVGNIKQTIEDFCPLINRINPATVISNLFYCLNVYDDYKMYSKNVMTLAIMTAVFTVGGFLFTRRKKYASL